MPDTTYLHIQGRESDPTRVVALPGAAVRIGRGPQCEIRLPEPDLAEVQCFLRLRGDTWQIQPVGPTRLITIEGNPVEHLRAWPFGVTLHVGTHRLVIRPSQWGTYQTPFEVGERFIAPRSVDPSPPPPPITSNTRTDGVTAPSASSEAEVERLKRWQSRLEQRERWLQVRQGEKTWESRWKAAGEGLRSRITPAGGSPRPDLVRPAAASPPRSVRKPPLTAEVKPAPATKPTSAQPLVAPKEPRALIALPKPESIETKPLAISVESSTIPEATQPHEFVSQVDVLKPETAEALFDSEILAVKEFKASEVIQTRMPIEQMLLIESDRPDPVWNQSSPHLFDLSTQPMIDRTEVSSANRLEPIEVEPYHEPAIAVAPLIAPKRDEYPSAAAIFAAQGVRSAPTLSAPKKVKRRPDPTDCSRPAEWVIPAWLGAPPVAIVTFGLIGIGLILGVTWTKDNQDAGIAVNAALSAEKGKVAPLDPTLHPETAWWKTTSAHLAVWAVAIERSSEAKDRVDEVTEILNAGSLAAPLQSEIRFALAQSERGTTALMASKALGVSRDIVSLTTTGRVLKRSGKVLPAIRAYRCAMMLSSEADASRLTPPEFDEEPHVRRFRLPHEALIQSVARDMMDAGEWSSDEWSKAVPASPVARIAVARLLREKGLTQGDALLDLLIAEVATPSSDGFQAAECEAAKAEALAFKDRKAESADAYRQAITLATDEITRRRWRLALAEILGSLTGTSQERADLLEAAKGSDPTEDVTQKAIVAQKSAGLR